MISIILFANLFSPSALIQQFLTDTGLVETTKQAREEVDHDVKLDEDVQIVNEEEELQNIQEVRRERISLMIMKLLKKIIFGLKYFRG